MRVLFSPKSQALPLTQSLALGDDVLLSASFLTISWLFKTVPKKEKKAEPVGSPFLLLLLLDFDLVYQPGL